jgi:hypothetical protein
MIYSKQVLVCLEYGDEIDGVVRSVGWRRLGVLLSLQETRAHQPAAGWHRSGTPQGATPRTVPIPWLLFCYTHRRMHSAYLCFACWFVCTCRQFSALVFRTAYLSSHFALHVFRKFAKLMQEWRIVFIISIKSSNDSDVYSLRIKRAKKHKKLI